MDIADQQNGLCEVPIILSMTSCGSGPKRSSASQYEEHCMKLHVSVQFYSVQSTNWSSDNRILLMKFCIVCELDFAATCMLMLTIGTVGGHTEVLMVIILL